jgi:Leucine-rich repeat (LRR) protein
MKLLIFNPLGKDSVPNSLKYLRKLQTLFLGHNKIKTIPKFLEELPNLDTLFVDNGLFTEEQKIRFKLPPMEYSF